MTAAGVTDPFTSSNQFLHPAAGNRYVQVDLQVENATDEGIVFSTLMQLKVRDSANRTFPITIVAEPGASVEGAIPPKAANRGFVYFEVPADSTGLALQVQGGITDDPILIALS